MNVQEAFKLLTLASARDGRTVDLAVATVWADDLADVSLMDAVQAAKDHYRDTDKWLMPVHVLDWVRARRRKELPGTMSEDRGECAPGSHRRLPDGTCMLCPHREFPDG